MKKLIKDGIIPDSIAIKIHQLKTFEQVVEHMSLPIKKKYFNFGSDPEDLESLKFSGEIDEITEQVCFNDYSSSFKKA